MGGKWSWPLGDLRIASLALALALGPLVASGAEPGSRDPGASAPVERLKVQVLAEYPHDPTAFTQGLLVDGEGILLESTGLRGASTLRRVELATGKILQEEKVDPRLFGEGLARVGEHLYQLTWEAEVGLLYRADTLAPAGQFHYPGEGWGLCFDGDRLVKSSGSSYLTFHDPKTFRETRRVSVTFDGRPVASLNELECVGGAVYANLWGTENLVRIDPTSGRVTAVIDAGGLLTPRERLTADVLNGIAYDPATDLFYLTGKLWPKVFAVAFVAQ
jgi:glutaminyl-peptide cyclotransferase